MKDDFKNRRGSGNGGNPDARTNTQPDPLDLVEDNNSSGLGAEDNVSNQPEALVESNNTALPSSE